jgi:MFS superfamily sulfate permease-like transporter
VIGSTRSSNPPSSVARASWLAGLRHWRHDSVAGLQVALLWAPFSLGVALASGAPAVAGLIAAIVAGLLYPLLGGAHVAVSGPAAALAPVMLWGILTLGAGDLAAGYPLVLVAIVATGMLQLLLAALRAGRYASMLPATVVEAMLAAIGIMIVLRQIPPLLGAPAMASPSALESIGDLPQQLAQAQALVAVVGIASLALMFALRRQVTGVWRWIPAAMAVAAFGAVAGWALGFDPSLRIRMPENFIAGLHAPAFSEVFARPDLWLTMALVVFTFTLIDGVESVASVKAVDKIDPWRRKSDANKTLRAMGVCNLASGMLGGLTVIPNAVPSRANIDAGARTLWSNLYSGLILLAFALAGSALLARIPLAAVAGILVYIGWRLCEPALFARMLAIGRDRFIVFVGTVAAILATDLLLGMLIGIALEMVLLVYLLMPSLRHVLAGRLDARAAASLLWTNFSGVYRDPVIRHRTERRSTGTVHVLTLGSLMGFNLLRLERALAAIPVREGVELRFTESAHIVDHTAFEFLRHAQEEAAAAGRPFATEGLERFHRFSPHPLATGMQEAQMAQQQAQRDERSQLMARFARQLGLSFSPTLRAVINRHDFVYLRRGDQREECNVIHGPWATGAVRVFDYSHTSPPAYHVAHRHTLLVYQPPGSLRLPDFVLAPGHYLDRYLGHLNEVAGGEGLAGCRLYAPPGTDPTPLPPAMLLAQRECGPLYIEVRRGVLLAFAPLRGLEDVQRIECLMALPQRLADAAGESHGKAAAH